MKKIFYLFVIATLFIACGKDDENPELREFYIQGVDNISYNKSADIHLQTAHDVVTYTDTIALYLGSDERGGTYIKFTTNGNFDTGCNNLDTINNRLCMLYGNFDRFENNPFLNSYNVLITSWKDGWAKDTIAYIPKQQIEDVKKIIAPLWDNGKGREECFKYFQDAFFFYPCSASEYKEMMKNGTY